MASFRELKFENFLIMFRHLGVDIANILFFTKLFDAQLALHSCIRLTNPYKGIVFQLLPKPWRKFCQEKSFNPFLPSDPSQAGKVHYNYYLGKL